MSFGLNTHENVQAAAGVNEQVNYQGRLLTATGAVVPDGTYNMEFKIIQDGDGCNPTSGTPPCGGTLKWTETRTSGNKVTVKNGYFSVYLGSVTPFSGSVDWNQDTLWLSVNIGGTGTPSWDGEMEPFNRLSATPYALNSKSLGGLVASNFVQLAQGAQADTSLLSSIYINKTGASGNILELEKNGVDVLTVGNSGALTVTGTTTINTTGTATTGIGNSTGALTLASGGTSSWNNTAGTLTIQTVTSGNLVLDSVAALNLGTTNSTSTNLGKTGTTLTINPTAWTATPTISGLITATSGLTSNGTLTVAGGQNFTMASGTGVSTQTHAPTTDATADANKITLSPGGTGSTGVLRGLVVSQADTATTGVYDTLLYLENLKTPETTTNGLLVTNNASGGTLSNALHITNTAGTLTSAITIDGTAPSSFILDSGSIDISGSGAITGLTTLSASGQITSTVSTGTAPFVVASTTNVANLNASSLNGATFAAPGSIGSGTPGSGAFTTLTSSGATTLGTGSSLTNTFGSGASSVNTIGSVTTPGALTLHGATTLDNTFTVSGSNLTSLGGNLTVTGTAWTATPTISGLVTATSGLTSNGTSTFNTNADFVYTDAEDISVTSSITGTTAVDVQNISITNQTSSGQQRGLYISNENHASNAVTEALLVLWNGEDTANTVTDYILINKNASGPDTTSDAIDVSDSDLYNAINVGDNRIAGTAAVIDFTSFDVSAAGVITLAGAQTADITTGGATALSLDTGGAAAINIGSATNATSVSICNSAACDTINIGTNADADTITIGDSTDTALKFGKFTTANGVLYISATDGTVSETAASTGTQCLQTASAGTAPIWGSCGGAATTLQTAYDAGNTITTTTARDIAFTLADVASPTKVSITQQDPGGTSALYVNNANASGTNTNGLLVEQTGAGTLTNGVNITQTAGALTNGLTFSGTFTKLINSTNFNVTNAGALTAVGVNSGSGQIQGTGGISVSGSATLAGTAGNTVTLGNTTGAVTITSGGTSSWTNTSGALTIQTATSGNTVIDSAGVLQLGITNSTATSLGKAATTLTINPTAWTATPTISGLITATSGITSNGVATFNTDANFALDGAENVDITYGSAPTSDLVSISNAGQGTTTDQVVGLKVNFVQGNDAASDTNYGIRVDGTTGTESDNFSSQIIFLTNKSVGGAQTALTITNQDDATNATTEALLWLNNAETTADKVTDYLLLSTASTDTATDAIDVSAAGFFNAINIGANNIAGTNFNVSSAGNITVAAAEGLDTNGAGALELGKANATSVDICNSANCDTINIGNLATVDADTIIIGDSLDTTSINSTGWSITGAGALTVASCTGCGGGGATLQTAYNTGNTITTTDGRDIEITLANTTTDQTFEITQAGTALAFRVNDDGTFTDSTAFVVNDAGNVGIGTTAPQDLLHINAISNGANINALRIQNSGTGDFTAATLEFYLASNQYGQIQSKYESGAYLHLMSTGSTPHLTIGPGGNVGIGDVVPLSNLAILGTSTASPSSTNAIFKVAGSATNALIMGTLTGSPFATYIQSGGSGVYPLSLNPNGGKVGIGTTAPGQDLNLVTTTAWGGIKIQGGTANSGIGMQFQNDNGYDWEFNVGGSTHSTIANKFSIYDANVGADRLVIDTAGNVGIGDTTPDYKLDVAGTFGVDGNVTVLSSSLPGLNGSGLVAASSNAAYQELTRTTTTVSSTNDVGQYSSVAMGNDGLAVISYILSTSDDLYVTKCGNAACSSGNTTTPIDTAAQVGKYNSIAIGTDGFPVISYLDESSINLKVTKCGNAACSSGNVTNTVYSTGDVGYYTSIAIGADGFPVISHYDATVGNLKILVTKCSNADCSSSSTNTIDTGSSAGSRTSIAIGADGFPVVAALEPNVAFTIRITKCGNAACSASNTTTPLAGGNGTTVSLAVGPDGLPVFAYNNGGVKVTKCTNTSCTAGTHSWITSTTNLSGYYGLDLAIGSNGMPVISYADGANTDLRVARCANPACNIGTTTASVDTADLVGVNNSIAIGPEGYPVISYYDDTNDNLEFARCVDLGCGDTTNSSYSGSGVDMGNSMDFFRRGYFANLYTSSATFTEDGLTVGNGNGPAVAANGDVKIGAQTDTASTGTATATTNGTAGTFGSQANIDNVASSAVFKGKLFVATNETDVAGVYRYDGDNTWTLVTNAAGKAVSADTANIDSYVLAVHNGRLYIGSQTGASTGAVYYSETADYLTNSFTMLNATVGTFASAGQDGVSDMTAYNGSLIIATQEPNAAELVRYGSGTTFTQLNITDGKVVAETTADKDGFVIEQYGQLLWVGGISGSTTNVVATYNGNSNIAGNWVNTTVALTGGTFGDQTSISDTNSMSVYNGSLYISMSKTAGNAAVVFQVRQANLPTANTGAATFTRVNTTVGKLIASDAADIDSIQLFQYNGRLYGASTTGSGTAAFYEYTNTGSGLEEWTLMNTTRGTFGSDTTINGISTMVAYNDTLYMGSSKSNAGSVYSWSKTAQNSYGLKFDSGSENIGEISFVGNRQAVSNRRQYGTFNFSHALASTSGAFDYAEDYPTLDSTLEAGEPVSVDPSYPDHVKRATKGEQVLGVMSENPGFRLSSTVEPASGAAWVPIALVGRVPVRVTTHEGASPINPGDAMALSDTPGLLEKAGAGSGAVVGVALEGYSGENVGKISLYVSPQVQANPVTISTTSPTEGLDIDAGHVEIKAELDAAEVFAVKDKEGNQTITFDSDGNATFSGTLTADKIVANKIEGLEILTNKISNLESQVAGESTEEGDGEISAPVATPPVELGEVTIEKATVTLDLEVSGMLFANGGLKVDGPSEFMGDAIFNSLVSFIGPSEFTGDANFAGRATFNNDTGGFAVIQTGKQEVKIVFDRPYAEIPVVSLTNKNGQFVDYAYKDLTKDGFTIILKDPATSDVEMSWTALSVKQAKVTVSP